MKHAAVLQKMISQVEQAAHALLSSRRFEEAREALDVLIALQRVPEFLSTQAEPPPQQGNETSEDPELTRNDYPDFRKEEDILLKVGWSAKNSAEYVHRVPKSGVDVVCERIIAAAREMGEFSRDDLEDLVDQDGQPIPDYQVYLVLAWLRWGGLVRQEHRGSYVVAQQSRFDRLIEAQWKSLRSEGAGEP